MKEAKLLLLTTEGKVSEVTCDSLEDYYRYLEADIFDVTTRKIGGKYFDIFCDDLGLFRENPKVSALYADFTTALVGNLIFANHDSQGNTVSLSEDDKSLIKSKLMWVYNFDEGELTQVIVLDD